MDSNADLPSRDEALALLHEYTEKSALVQHALAVEAAMRAHARRLGADEHSFGLAGLLHDFDYDRYPSLEDHPFRGAEILERRGWPAWFRRAILSHAPHTGVRRETDLEKCLFASDELCGFLTACVYVRPDRSIRSVRVSSVRKKMKSKAFARSVNREEIAQGAAEIGMDLDAHIAFVVEALAAVADDLGLAGVEGEPA
jgi:putative nucleotidyltransferase with HDIG domain